MNNDSLGPLPGQNNNQQPSQANADSLGPLPQQSPGNTNMTNGVQSLQGLNTLDATHGDRLHAIDQTSQGLGASTMAFIDNFNKQMSAPPQAIMQILGLGDYKGKVTTPTEDFSNLPTSDMNKALASLQSLKEGNYTTSTPGMSINEQKDAMQQAAAQSLQQHPIAGGLGAIAGIGGSLVNQAAMTGGGGLGVSLGKDALGETAMPLVENMANGSLNAGLYGALQPISPGESRLVNSVTGMAIGAAMPPALEGLKAATEDVGGGLYNWIKTMVNPKGTAMDTVVDAFKKAGVTPEDFQQAATAGNNIGMPTSVAETTGKENIRALEKGLVPADAESMSLVQGHLDQIKGLADKVDDAINSIVPEGNSKDATQKVTEGYNALKQYEIPQDQYSQLMQDNPALIDEMNAYKNNTSVDPDIAALPDNNAAKLADMNKLINYRLALKEDPNAQGIMVQKGNMQDLLKAQIPGYEDLMDFAGRNSYRNQVLSELNNTSEGKGVDSLSAIDPQGNISTPISNIDQTLWGTPVKREQFLNMVDRAGGDTQNARDLITTVNRVIQTPSKQIVKNSSVPGAAPQIDVPKTNLLTAAYAKLATNRYNSELIKLMLGGQPAQQKIMAAITKQPLTTKIPMLANTLSVMKAMGNSTAASAIKDTGGITSKIATRLASSPVNNIANSYSGMNQ